jgi:hypothetical protein
VTLESLPNEGGMLPVNLFEFRALHKQPKVILTSKSISTFFATFRRKTSLTGIGVVTGCLVRLEQDR